jgi:ATP-dependent RNA circularization protein (DNA/RNA ligase family)
MLARLKMDGQNLNFIHNGKEFFLCSRNNRVTVKKGSKYEKVIEKYDIKNKMKSLKKELKHSFALQGELCGPGIQGNKYGFSDYMYFIYNFFDIDKKEYLRFKDILFILDYMNLKTVPILNNNFVLNHTQDELLELSKGKSIFADIPREGIVIRSLDCEKGSNKMGPIWGFKEINPDFKLKYEGR